MAAFSGLPNELILQIWSDVLEPKDVESFALVSTNVDALGHQSIQDHNRLKNHYAILFQPDHISGSHPAMFLENILLNPRAALYVNEIWLDDWDSEWDHPATIAFNGITNPHQPYSQATMQLFEEAVQTSGFIPECEAETWKSEISSGDERNILALIVSLLPNVRSFKVFQGLPESGNRMSQMIRRIGESTEAAALSCLTDVQIGWWDDTEVVGNDFDWVKTFSSLKSVKSIKGCGVRRLQTDFEYWFSLPPRWSNVTCLHLQHCDIKSKDLFIYLQSLGALETFSYTSARPAGSFEPFWLCTALAHAAHSLKSLRMLSCNGTGKQMGSLAGLNVLTVLFTEYNMLLDYIAKSDEQKLAQSLPLSIETVTLQHNDRYDLRILQGQVLGMCKLKAERLPHLKVLTFWINTSNIRSPIQRQSTRQYFKDSEIIATLKQKSMEVGVELDISQLDRDFGWLS